ncbi:MAG: YdeI/OmpD-associated family protein [Burkholderiaceae bacterium]
MQRPKDPGKGSAWGFVILPMEVSAKLPRRGRTSIDGTINGHGFRALLEPDGMKSHWLRIDQALFEAAGVALGEMAQLEIMAVEQEPEPEVPADLLKALEASPDSRATWNDTTTLARLDWIHWVTSAKQEKTRKKRIKAACDMLASEEKRVCCFDPSGYYSKAFSAPQSAD